MFSDVEHDEAVSTQIEVTVWNFSHNVKHECIGNWPIAPRNTVDPLVFTSGENRRRVYIGTLPFYLALH